MIFVFEPINDKFTKFVECGRVRVKVQVAQKIYIYIYCGDQLYSVFKIRWKRPGPISNLIYTSCVRKGQVQCPI